jgi:hypothetical protein
MHRGKTNSTEGWARRNLHVFFPEERGIAFNSLLIMTHRVIMIAFFLL